MRCVGRLTAVVRAQAGGDGRAGGGRGGVVDMREIPLCPTAPGTYRKPHLPFSALHRAMALHRLCPLAVGGVPVAAVLFVMFASFVALALLLAVAQEV